MLRAAPDLRASSWEREKKRNEFQPLVCYLNSAAQINTPAGDSHHEDESSKSANVARATPEYFKIKVEQPRNAFWFPYKDIYIYIYKTSNFFQFFIAIQVVQVQ